ncbi:MAG: FAD/NAD(P)-binding protein [Thermosynechococcaceae cyanobacterium]
MSNQIDIAVIGAGPQALTLVTHLLQKKQSLQARIQVFDPSGTWMAQWRQQFAAQEIPYLRSPGVHHPDPRQTLFNFAERRQDELHQPYNRPGTELFQDFCETVIDRWNLRDGVTAAQVVKLMPLPSRFQLLLDNGEQIEARRVVLATGGGKMQIPAWVNQVNPHPPERLCHAQAVCLPKLPDLTGETILMIGSGQSSAHLAVGAVGRGARVLFMARRTLTEKLFDTEPGWLGPKYLKGFQAEPDWQVRWQMIQEARNGGSITPESLTRLQRYSRSGQVTFYENCQVSSATWRSAAWHVQCSLSAVHDCLAHQSIDRIWLATGTQTDITAHPLLREVLWRYPNQIVNGLPVLDEHLRWPGCELFLMGPWAALQVGPVARNLHGGRMACDRIVPALTKSTVARTVRA